MFCKWRIYQFRLIFSKYLVFYGTSKVPNPTNAIIPKFISLYKRYCNREIGQNIFRRSFHDHIIRGEEDCIKIAEYIDANPLKWELDCFYEKTRQWRRCLLGINRPKTTILAHNCVKNPRKPSRIPSDFFRVLHSKSRFLWCITVLD